MVIRRTWDDYGGQIVVALLASNHYKYPPQTPGMGSSPRSGTGILFVRDQKLPLLKLPELQIEIPNVREKSERPLHIEVDKKYM